MIEKLYNMYEKYLKKCLTQNKRYVIAMWNFFNLNTNDGAFQLNFKWAKLKKLDQWLHFYKQKKEKGRDVKTL